MSKKVTITDDQRAKLERLWFVFGNSGKKSTLFNHKLIQGFIESGEDRREDYKDVNINLTGKYGIEYALKNGITDECLEAVKNIIDNV